MPEPGTYCGNLKAAVTSTAKTGSPQIALQFNIEHKLVGEEWSQLTEPIERIVFLSMHENAAPFSEERLLELGFNGDFANPQFSKAEAVTLQCSMKTYEGRQQERWEIPREGGGLPEQTDRATLQKLNALWKSKHGSASKPKPAPAGASTTPF